MTTDDRAAGMVSAELAVALPAVALVLALCAGGLAFGIDQVRCADAVRVGARAIARGEPTATARAAVEARAPRGADVVIVADEVAATVTVHGPPPGLLAATGWTTGCAATAVTPTELGADGGTG